MAATTAQTVRATNANDAPDNISHDTPKTQADSHSGKSIDLQPLEIIEPNQNAEGDGVEYPTGAKFWLIMLSVGIVLVLGGLDGNIVATAVPAITDHFHTVADVGWYSSVYKLCACSFQFMFGKMYKIFSVKHIFLISVAIFLLGSVFCATAVTSPMFVVGRAVTGLGTSGIIAGAFTLLVQTMPLRKRPIFTGVLGAGEGVATVVAPIVGGVLTQSLSWRWCFYINLPIGGVALIVTALFLSDPRVSEGANMTWKQKLQQLDLIGNLVFVPSITCLFIALSWAGTKYHWSDPKVIGPLIAFPVLLGVFIYDQYRKGDSATLPLRILKNRSVISGAIFSICTNSAMNVIEYYMPTYYQAVREYSPARSGYMTLPAIIGFLVAILMAGAGTTMFGYYTPFMLFASVLMPIGAGLMTTWKVNTSLAYLILYPAIAGFAGGIGFQGPQSAVQTTLPTADGPLGLSVILFSQHFGPAVFVVVAQTILTNQLSKNLSGLAPGLDAKSIENMGLSDLKATFGDKLEEALIGFDKSIIQTWYLVVGLACATMIGSASMEWRSVKQKKS